ncbi:SMC-Scp complex subunit ScpB [Thalassotalea agarivorans]|uniref:Segregation and condensation protein B n=1 Tax=Thalassotalea agarivorans TaxID=349064 RepID=A0A1I0EN29_THASX|nr:SMC-Scp complex subunit ScpB [Thalassotalea agarivorans]SET46663.1 segregation and condensation protein B [Thalassotalea agarivorans]
MKKLNHKELKKLIEATIFVSPHPISVVKMKETTLSDIDTTTKQIKLLLEELQNDYQDKGIELVEVASGYRFQAVASLSDDLSYLFKERAPKYSRALLETLSLIAYKQPITRGEIEDVRGVSVSSYIIKTLLEREWIRVIGHKEVPGRPALYGTTKAFLDYFNLTSLEQLPVLEDIEPIDVPELELVSEGQPVH